MSDFDRQMRSIGRLILAAKVVLGFSVATLIFAIVNLVFDLT